MFLLSFVLTIACTPEKNKAAVQNNKLVTIHGQVVKSVTELDAAKRDNAKFLPQLNKTIGVIQEQTKELDKQSVLPKLTEVKDQLDRSLKELSTGYAEVEDLYKNEKIAEAKTKLETVEKAFQANTAILQQLQAKVAREYDIPIAAPAPPTPPERLGPAETDAPSGETPASTAPEVKPEPLPAEPSGPAVDESEETAETDTE